MFHQFVRHLYNTDELSSITPSSVRRFIQEQVIKQKNKPRALQRRISCLKSFSKFCIKEKWIEVDFMAGVPSPKMDKRLPTYLRLEELKQLFSSLELCKQKNRKNAVRNELIFKLLATTDMRRQEIVDLTCRQLDLEQKSIRVFGKGRKERLLPLHPVVLPLIKQYQASQPVHLVHDDMTVFVNPQNKPIDPRVLHRIFKQELVRAGLPPTRFTLHHLRHSFATILLQGGDVDLKTLQDSGIKPLIAFHPNYEIGNIFLWVRHSCVGQTVYKIHIIKMSPVLPPLGADLSVRLFQQFFDRG